MRRECSELISRQFQGILSVLCCRLKIEFFSRNVLYGTSKFVYANFANITTDLYVFCRREESDIPLIVIGCVQEIERRGGFKMPLSVFHARGKFHDVLFNRI